jgi:hypothetical protein
MPPKAAHGRTASQETTYNVRFADDRYHGPQHRSPTGSNQPYQHNSNVPLTVSSPPTYYRDAYASSSPIQHDQSLLLSGSTNPQQQQLQQGHLTISPYSESQAPGHPSSAQTHHDTSSSSAADQPWESRPTSPYHPQHVHRAPEPEFGDGSFDDLFSSGRSSPSSSLPLFPGVERTTFRDIGEPDMDTRARSPMTLESYMSARGGSGPAQLPSISQVLEDGQRSQQHNSHLPHASLNPQVASYPSYDRQQTAAYPAYGNEQRHGHDPQEAATTVHESGTDFMSSSSSTHHGTSSARHPHFYPPPSTNFFPVAQPPESDTRSLSPRNDTTPTLPFWELDR